MEVEGWFAAVEWPVGIGAKRNEGVAKSVARTEGAIGYVEYAAAKEHELTYAAMINKEGKIVAPAMTSFQAAAANADWKSVPGYGLNAHRSAGRRLMADHGGKLHSHADRRARRRFFRRGAQMAEALSYVPMPDQCGRPRSRGMGQDQGPLRQAYFRDGLT